MGRRRLHPFWLALLVSATALACSPRRPPDLVLLVLCSTRYDHLGFAGYERDTTPFLDSLAERGVRFTNAMSAANWTKPATASLLTGLTPNVHGLTEQYRASEIRSQRFAPRRILSESVTTLPELLQGANYASIGLSNNPHASDAFNLMQGFGHAVSTERDDGTLELLDRFEAWLGELDAERPFFLFLLTSDAHISYRPRYEFYRRFARSPVSQRRYPRWVKSFTRDLKRVARSGAAPTAAQQEAWIDLYDAELAQLDAALATLPARLARADRRDPVFVVTADHGEHFFDVHGDVGHGPTLDEPLIHIPLLFQGPGLRSGVAVPDLVRSIDVLPTLAELAGLPAPPEAQGSSLGPVLTGRATLPPRTGFASYGGAAHAVRLGDAKLWLEEGGEPALYDLGRDPEERENRAELDPELASRLRKELAGWLRAETALRETSRPTERRSLSEAELQRLRELGYVGD